MSQPWSSPASSAPLLHSSSAATLPEMANCQHQCIDPRIVDVSERPYGEEQRLQSCGSARGTGAIEILYNPAKANADTSSVTGAPACTKTVTSLSIHSTVCRREHDGELSEGCTEELFRVELEAAADYRTDAELNKYCQADAKQYCPDVEPGDGRVQDCLVRGNAVSRPLLLAAVWDPVST